MLAPVVCLITQTNPFHSNTNNIAFQRWHGTGHDNHSLGQMDIGYAPCPKQLTNEKGNIVPSNERHSVKRPENENIVWQMRRRQTEKWWNVHGQIVFS